MNEQAVSKDSIGEAALPRPCIRRRRRAWAGIGSARALAAAVLGLAGAANAEPRRFDIPAGPAVKAIPEFGRQAGVQILAPADQLRGLTTPRVHGLMEPHEALRRLISGTRLEVASQDVGLITLRTAPAANPVAAATRTVPLPPLAPVRLDEVVVRANKRLERLQEVPIAVTAVSAERGRALGVDDISSLQAVVPGLEFSRFFNGATPTLRGVGSATGIGAEEPAVALYVDDVYIAASSATIFALNNIDRIEVSKGPQGALFGRNATGGVIQIFSRTPSWTPRADVRLGAANYGTFSGSVYVAGGVTDRVAADLAVTARSQTRGWGRNLLTGEPAFTSDEVYLRSRWLFEPDPRASLILAADWGRNRYSSGVAMRPAAGAIFPGGFGFEGFYNVNEAPTGYTDTRQGGVSARLRYDLPFVQLVSITAWRAVDARVHADEDQTPRLAQDFDYLDARRTFTEELRLLSPSEAGTRWIVGLFHFHDLSKLDPFTSRGSAFLPYAETRYDVGQLTRSYAGFGEVTLGLDRRTLLTLGARYTYDHRSLDAAIWRDGVVTDSARKHSGAGAATYRISLSRDLSPGAMAYASYSRGFKSGLYNSTNLGSGPVRPEFLDAYEAGVKSNLLGDRLRLNASAFYYKFHDLQVLTLVEDNGATSSVLQNAAQSSSRGVDLDFEAAPTERLTIRGGLVWIRSVFDSFPDATLSAPLPGGGNSTHTGPATGNRTPRSPDLTANLSVTYRVVGRRGECALTLADSYDGGFFWDADNRLRQAPYHLVEASLAWTASDGRWAVRLWSKNLLDVRYSVYTTANVVGDEESPGPPLTFGATLERHF